MGMQRADVQGRFSTMLDNFSTMRCDVTLSRVRGLKRHVLLTLDFDAGRTLTSAWIETMDMPIFSSISFVALLIVISEGWKGVNLG